MTQRRTSIALLLSLAAIGFCSTARADETAPVLKGSQVTESALIDALAVDTPASAAGATRGFRPANTPGATSGGAQRPAKAAPGKASLLITFMTDSSQLSTEASRSLDVVAKALQSDQLAGLSFTVEGHADPRGSEERNLALSKSRAKAVIDYLIAKHGVLAERLNAVGKGSSEPMDRAHPEAPENRRVTIVTRRD